MKESVAHRHTCSDLNGRTVYYELSEDLPDFSKAGMRDPFTVVLRSQATRQLEEIDIRIVGMNRWAGTEKLRNAWGEIVSDDMDENYSTLHFEYDWNGRIEKIYAVRDTPGVPPERMNALAQQAKYAAEITALDAHDPQPSELSRCP